MTLGALCHGKSGTADIRLTWFSDKFLKVTIEGDVDAARSQELDVPEPGKDKVKATEAEVQLP